MKIAIIGPASPYRGGIAHHSNMMAATLRDLGHSVDKITFLRQYPRWCYPGTSQTEEGGDEGSGSGSERLIDTLDPRNWRRTGDLLRARRYDLCLFRFWTPYLAPCLGGIARRLDRGADGDPQVMVLIDNLFPHERHFYDRLLLRFFFQDRLAAVTQCSAVADQLRATYPRIRQEMIPHPTYSCFGERLPQEEARRRLGLGAGKILLFFGFVRRYKGLDRLLEAMPEMTRREPAVQLHVVGEFFENPCSYHDIVARRGVMDHVTFHNRYAPKEEIASWFSAADALVLPYRSATNSGIVQIAHHFELPSIVTNVGSLAEVVADGQTGLVIEDATPDRLAKAVARILRGDTLAAFSRRIRAENRRYDVRDFCDRVVQFASREAGRARPIADASPVDTTSGRFAVRPSSSPIA